MLAEVVMQPVGEVRGGREKPDDDSWDSVDAEIVLDGTRFGADALAGLGDFSHIKVVFHFNRVPTVKSTPAIIRKRIIAQGPRARCDRRHAGAAHQA